MSEKVREKLTLDKQDARDLTYGDEIENFKIIEDEIVGTKRWSIVNRLVIQRESDGKFFASEYSTAATECQEERPWEYEDAIFDEVFPVEKMVTVYE